MVPFQSRDSRQKLLGFLRRFFGLVLFLIREQIGQEYQQQKHRSRADRHVHSGGMLDVIGNVQSKPGGLLSKAQALYFVRIIQQHPVLEIYQLFWGSEKLALLDIGITEGKGIVYIHPARISQPLNFLSGSVYASGCDEKGNTTDALLKEVPAWQPGSWYETCKGKPNQKELEAMLGRPYHFVKPRKGQFTMDNSVEEMKDASSAGAPLRSMQISGGMKGGLVPALLEFANGHFLRGIWKMITG